jgi:hypothetical protein
MEFCAKELTAIFRIENQEDIKIIGGVLKGNLWTEDDVKNDEDDGCTKKDDRCKYYKYKCDSKEQCFAASQSESVHGILIESSRRISISNIRMENFPGDGIYIGGQPRSKEINISSVEALQNRRAGISIVYADRVRIINSIFRENGGIYLETEKDPTSAFDYYCTDFNIGGINLEAKNSIIRNVIIHGCKSINNIGIYAKPAKI